ncbi:hypothetical protein, partial [Microcoleus sp. BROC3]|uniref:hypothetical protein n=1 Tax=Microcoleus sp. BROC3 TaxID=3055323 RepID=UPI002FD6888D
DFKIPKAFRPQLFDCYPLTGQDSIYYRTNYTIANQRDMILENSIIHPCIRVKIRVVPSSLP